MTSSINLQVCSVIRIIPVLIRKIQFMIDVQMTRFLELKVSRGAELTMSLYLI